MDARGHRALLDAFAGAEAGLAAVRDAWAARAAAARALDEARERVAAAGRDRDFLAHAVAELEALAPEPEEEPALDARRRTLRAAEKIREDVARAAEALGPAGAEGPLLQALRWLETAAAQVDAAPGGPLDAAADGLGRVLTDLGEVAGIVEGLLADLGGEPGELERVEERLFAIRGLARKHQVAPEALAGARRRFRRPARGDRRRRGRDRPSRRRPLGRRSRLRRRRRPPDGGAERRRREPRRSAWPRSCRR